MEDDPVGPEAELVVDRVDALVREPFADGASHSSGISVASCSSSSVVANVSIGHRSSSTSDAPASR